MKIRSLLLPAVLTGYMFAGAGCTTYNFFFIPSCGDGRCPVGDDDSALGDDDSAGDDDTVWTDDDSAWGDDDSALGDDDSALSYTGSSTSYKRDQPYSIVSNDITVTMREKPLSPPGRLELKVA